MGDTAKCMVPGCKRRPISRGVCNSCYRSASRAMKARVLSERQLVEAGLLLPKYDKAKRKLNNPMALAIQAMSKSEGAA